MTEADAVARGGMLIGREAELGLFSACLADLEAGTALLVRGPAGIGKTALIDEAVRRAGCPGGSCGLSAIRPRRAWRWPGCTSFFSRCCIWLS